MSFNPVERARQWFNKRAEKRSERTAFADALRAFSDSVVAGRDQEAIEGYAVLAAHPLMRARTKDRLFLRVIRSDRLPVFVEMIKDEKMGPNKIVVENGKPSTVGHGGKEMVVLAAALMEGAYKIADWLLDQPGIRLDATGFHFFAGAKGFRELPMPDMVSLAAGHADIQGRILEMQGQALTKKAVKVRGLG